jgi:hypothetical protein
MVSRRKLDDGVFLKVDPTFELSAHVIMLPLSLVKNPDVADSMDKVYVDGSLLLI